LARWADLWWKLFAAESEWVECWRKRMDLNQSVMLNFKVLEVR
jgi:hypothetical protein